MGKGWAPKIFNGRPEVIIPLSQASVMTPPRIGTLLMSGGAGTLRGRTELGRNQAAGAGEVFQTVSAATRAEEFGGPN